MSAALKQRAADYFMQMRIANSPFMEREEKQRLFDDIVGLGHGGMVSAGEYVPDSGKLDRRRLKNLKQETQRFKKK